jgi:acid phosphatase
VVQSAQASLQGYLYVFAQAYGTVVSINLTGSIDALGKSLSPADLCPAYTNDDGNNVTDCKSYCKNPSPFSILITLGDAVWMPAAIERINAMVTGNLTFDETDLTFFP